MKPNDVIKFLGNLLNININDKLTFSDIIEDLKSIHDLALFKEFMKANLVNDRYKYFTGYQKFIAMSNDFKKNHKIKLTTEQRFKADSFSDKLFSKVCDVFDFINWKIQTGEDLHSKNIDLFLFEMFRNESELKVLEKIGKREDLLRYMNNKEALKNKINDVVMNLTLLKNNPQLALKSSAAVLLENLTNK